MRKINYANVNLTCAFQQMTDLPTDHCIGGVLSRTDNSFKFEEAVKQSRRPKRNPKLFEGDFCSLVHMQNGKYQLHMWTINTSGDFKRNELAYKVYCEIMNAFEIIGD